MTALTEHATRLAAGSAALTKQFGAWMFDGPRLLLRAPGTVAAAWWIGWPTLEYAPGTAAAGVCWWCVAAWQAGGDAAGEPGEEAPAGPDVDELAEALHALADPHVHLTALAAALGYGTNTAPVRELLAAAEVPVTRGVRMAGKVNTGVRRDHFPPLPSPGPGAPGGVVAAGQASNSNSNGGLVIERGEGMTIIREPAETAARRTEVAR